MVVCEHCAEPLTLETTTPHAGPGGGAGRGTRDAPARSAARLRDTLTGGHRGAEGPQTPTVIGMTSIAPSRSSVRLAAALVVLAAAFAFGPTRQAQAVSQPTQQHAGPGGSDVPHGGWRVSAGGTGSDAWYVFEPARPRPAKAPLAVITHGYYEFEGYPVLYELIRHTVLTGHVVIYPRWQTDVAVPCPGPFDIEPCMASEVAGIRGALAFLKAKRSRVQPDLLQTSYFGFSFGGIITANLANRYASLHLPKPRAVFLDDLHDGGLVSFDESALDDRLAGIPSSTLFQCHSGADGVISGVGIDPANRAGGLSSPGGCNSVFPKLVTVPERNKDLVLTTTDRHGTPELSSAHGVCAGGRGQANAYDWNFCWKVWDALQSCAYERRDCRYALGDTPQHRSNGRWSDGVPVAPLKIQDAEDAAPVT